MTHRFISESLTISPSKSNQAIKLARSGWRALLKDKAGKYALDHHIGGQIPYFYREPTAIARDFSARHNALDMVQDLATKAPTTTKFQRSHCGEILAALYLEDVLGLKRLYSKLSLTTAENTNVHKMDGFFVNLNVQPFVYFVVEAKASVLPTINSTFSGHRHGIYKSMIGSFKSYSDGDYRFDLVALRDNLESGVFTSEQEIQIRRDLTPPGPENEIRLGVATVNKSTICGLDDEYILTKSPGARFCFSSVVVADLAGLADRAFTFIDKLRN